MHCDCRLSALSVFYQSTVDSIASGRAVPGANGKPKPLVLKPIFLFNIAKILSHRHQSLAMNSKNMRVPLSITFADGFAHQDEFLTRISTAGLFSIACPPDEYFGTIARMLIDGASPAEYITKKEPKFPGACAWEMHVSEGHAPSDSLHFAYIPDEPEYSFSTRAREIVEKNKKMHFLVMEEYAGLKFYKKYLMNSMEKKKSYAEALFSLGDYQQATAHFTSIASAYPEYGTRMATWCKILANQLSHEDAFLCGYSLDILLLHNKTQALYYLSGRLRGSTRAGVQCWLGQKSLRPGQRLLILYCCMRSLIESEDKEKAQAVLKQIKDEMASKMGQGSEWSRQLWEDVYRRIEAESLTM